MGGDAQSAEKDQAGDQHGSDFRFFLRGEWPACICGYAPRDNGLLNDHYASFGFVEYDDHGQLKRRPV